MYGSISNYKKMVYQGDSSPESCWHRNDRPFEASVMGVKYDGTLISGQDVEAYIRKPSKSKRFFGGVKRCLSSSATFIFLLFFIALPIAMLTMGLLHQSDCPLEPKIPLFLVVGGVSLISRVVLQMIFVIMDANFVSWREGYTGKAAQSIGMIMTVFNVAWFVAGCIFVYNSETPEFRDRNSPKYCEKTVYRLAFWFLNAVFIAFGVGTFAILFIATFVYRKT